MQVGPPVHPLQKMQQKSGDIVNVQRRIVFPRDDQQIFGQGELSLAEDGVGAGEKLLGLSLGGIGDIALRADGQQQGVDPGGIDGMDGMNSGHHGGDHGAGQVVNDLAEAGILLRRPADYRKGPDGLGAVVDSLDLEDGEVVHQTVVAEVVAEGAFGELAVVSDGRTDTHDRETIGGMVFRKLVAKSEEGAIGHVNLREVRPWMAAVSLHSLNLEVDFTGPVQAGLLQAQREALLGVA